ncbi:protein usf-like isoform X2 [Gigantopelta aegis]|nr:protein usf-like isoform X2 [Gigantopelta aegis]XP_041360642.1 protein usf-like isoform X2 [Gigantopelta aegis]
MPSFAKLTDPVSIPSKHPKGPVPAVQFGKPGVDSKVGIIVLQEWWGINDQILEEAQTIAKMGNFITIVPDLYRGEKAVDNEHAGHLMDGLDWPGAIEDIRGCTKYLKEKGCTKVGVTGFCMGGALAMASAAMITEVDASVPFYGIPGDGLCDISKIQVPLQCHFGCKDAMNGFTGPEDQVKMKEKLDKGKVRYEFHSYEAGHAFTHKGGPNFNQEATDQSLRRMCEFFKKHL